MELMFVCLINFSGFFDEELGFGVGFGRGSWAKKKENRICFIPPFLYNYEYFCFLFSPNGTEMEALCVYLFRWREGRGERREMTDSYLFWEEMSTVTLWPRAPSRPFIGFAGPFMQRWVGLSPYRI